MKAPIMDFGSFKLDLGELPTRMVNAKAYGASGNGVSDDTAALSVAAIAAAGATLFLPPGIYLTDGLTVQAGTTVQAAKGAILKGRSGTADVLTITTGCRVFGLEVDGNKTVRNTAGHGIRAANADNIVIRDCYTHDCYDSGIELETVTEFLIENCRVEDTAVAVDAGINIKYCSRGQVANCYVDTNNHGIEFLGGDAAQSTVPGAFDLVFSGNIVKNAKGGIWGGLGQRIMVVANSVENCTDVGIDLEGCFDSTISGNSVRNASNGCIAIYLHAKNISVTGNTCVITEGTGSRYGIWLTEHAANKKQQIAIVGNVIESEYTNASKTGIYCNLDCDALQVSNNVLRRSNIVNRHNHKAVIRGNVVDLRGLGAISLIGIQWLGGKDGLIEGNQIIRDQDAEAGVTNAGIYIGRVDGTLNAFHNTVRENRVEGFSKSITDGSSWDSGYNLIENNRVSGVISRPNQVGWKGYIGNNRSTSDPRTVVGETLF